MFTTTFYGAGPRCNPVLSPASESGRHLLPGSDKAGLLTSVRHQLRELLHTCETDAEPLVNRERMIWVHNGEVRAPPYYLCLHGNRQLQRASKRVHISVVRRKLRAFTSAQTPQINGSALPITGIGIRPRK